MKLSIFCLMLLLGLPGYSQEGEVTRPEDLEQRVHVIGTPADAPAETQANPQNPDQTPAIRSDNEDDQMIEGLEEDRKKSTEAAVKLDETKNQMTEAVFNAPEELKKLGHETISGASLMDEKVVMVLKKMLEQNAMSKASDAEVKAMIMEKAKGSAIEKFLVDHPKVTNMFVEILKDSKAMPSLVGVFLRKDDLKVYGLIWLGLMIFAWLFKKTLYKKNKKWTSGQRMLVSLLVSIGITFTSLTIFYNMFHDEISPTAKIIVKHWRKRNL